MMNDEHGLLGLHRYSISIETYKVINKINEL